MLGRSHVRVGHGDRRIMLGPPEDTGSGAAPRLDLVAELG